MSDINKYEKPPIARFDDSRFSKHPIKMALAEFRAEQDKALDLILTEIEIVKARQVEVEQRQAAFEAKVEAERKAIEANRHTEYEHLLPFLKRNGIEVLGEGPGRTGHIHTKCCNLGREMGYDIDSFPRERLEGFCPRMYPPRLLNRFVEQIRKRHDWHHWFRFRKGFWQMTVSIDDGHRG